MDLSHPQHHHYRYVTENVRFVILIQNIFYRELGGSILADDNN